MQKEKGTYYKHKLGPPDMDYLCIIAYCNMECNTFFIFLLKNANIITILYFITSFQK
jgi:hypothetical protein